jgi:hypothetical protein
LLQIPWFVECAGRFAAIAPNGLNSSGMNVLVDCPGASDAKLVVGRKPPWNQPQESPAAFSSSPMF